MQLARKLQSERYKHLSEDEQKDINVGTFTKFDVSDIRNLVVVVYDITTTDKTNWYTARIFDCDKPTPFHILRMSYDEIAEEIKKAFPQLIPFSPGADDDKAILKIWL